METPKNKAGYITEKIMLKIAKYINKSKYNFAWGWVLTTLEEELCEPEVTDEEIDLPEFLYESEGEIKIGYLGGSTVTDEWNNWKSKWLRNKK